MSVRKSVDLPVNSGSSAIFATHGFTIPAKDFLSTSYLKLINKQGYFFFAFFSVFSEKHARKVTKMKKIIA